jgi:putative flippase GtrA
MYFFFTAPLRFGSKIFKQSTVMRYFFSGGTSALLELLVLFVLVNFFRVFYLSAAIVAMTVAFIARFLLQKYVTFGNKDKTHVLKQLSYYAILYFISLCATAWLLYGFVEVLGIWYLFAQILSIIIVATGCFFIYKIFIFRTE